MLLLEEFGRAIVSGEIGTGKSSLAMAVVFARIVAHPPDGDVERPFVAVVIRPGVDPWARTEAAFAAAWADARRAADPVDRAVSERMRATRDGRDPAELWNLWTELARDRGRILVLIDQSEELITYGVDDNHRRAYLNALAHAFAQRLDPRVRLLATVRSDVLPALLSMDAWRAPPSGAPTPIYTLAPMTPDALSTAIREPARRRGVDVEDALVATITREAGQTTVALPLVSAVLDAIWRRRPRRGVGLTTSAYQEIGGIQRALDMLANQFWSTCTSSERVLLDRILPCLVDQAAEGVVMRRRVLVSELVEAVGGADEVRHLVDRLGEERLLVASTERDVVRVELAHDALIHHAQWLMRAGLIYTKTAALTTSTETLRRARDLYRRAIDARDQRPVISACERHRQLSFTNTLIGNNLQNLQDWEGARRAHEEAVRVADDSLDRRPCKPGERARVQFRRMQARLALGSVLAESGDLQHAEEAYTAAYALPQEGASQPDASLTLRMAALRWRLGHADEAHQLALSARDLFLAQPDARFEGGAQYALLLARESERPLAAATHTRMRFVARPLAPAPEAPSRCLVELTGPLEDGTCFPRCRVRAACEGGPRARTFDLALSCVNCQVSPPTPAHPDENTITGADNDVADVDGDGSVRFDTSTRRITLSPPEGNPRVEFELLPPSGPGR